MSIIFQNYHKHSYYTNIKVPDSTTSYEEYCKRAVELGHGIISSVEHGWQGRYIECHQLAEKYGLKFLFGTEAYWVKDRFFIDEDGHRDGSNCHICILAMNENGRQAINKILSQASEDCYFKDAFYRQTRIDLPLIMSLPADDVVITTACLAFHKYEDTDDIILSLADKFKKNFYLEVQYHNTEDQKKLNRHLLDLKNKYNLQLIMGCDSHYIDEKGKIDRDEYIKSKGIDYSDEEGWYMDYPDGDTAYQRFVNQCILSHNEIMEAINNTNRFLEVEEYDCPIFNHDIKMPTLFPELSQEEKNQKYEDLIWEKWEEYKQEVSPDKWDEYVEAISNEVDIVKTTLHADYFLLDYYISQLGKKKGGKLTLTGRGSAVSFITNKLLGFTNVDRVASKVKMYPERFMSPTRILETHSLADIDMNCPKQEPFWEAQEELVGYNHSKQMIAFGSLKPPAAWKMYAKAQNVDFETSNEISNQIKKWQKDVSHADEDSKDDIDIMDYIDKQYQEIYEKSTVYQGIVSSIAPHPCASLIYQGNIAEEIGYLYVKPKTGEPRLCCCMDGKWAEKYGFLKNDWLKVNVYELIYDTFDLINIEPLSVNQLLKECSNDTLAWDMYKKQCTFGLNQVEQVGSAARVSQYAPQNISELTAFCAAIRPGFKTMYKKFASREPFSYNINTFDNLIRTDEMPNTFILYQEQVMATLHYAGIPMSECYGIIKSIAKKRPEEVFKYKETFLEGFAKKVIEDEHVSEEKASEITQQVWAIIEANSGYGFNASHAYCVALDSLYGAWLKSHYPLEFYTIYINILNQKGDKDRLNLFKTEAEDYFKIKFSPYRWGQDNRQITCNKETNSINSALSSIKGYSDTIGEILYECYQNMSRITYDFWDILDWLYEHSIKAAKIEPLIKIDFFRDLGNINQLLVTLECYELLKQGTAKSISKSKLEQDSVLYNLLPKFATDIKKDGEVADRWTITDMDSLVAAVKEDCSKIEEPSLRLKIKMQTEILGYFDITTDKKSDIKKVIITDCKPLIGKYSPDPWSYRLETKSIGSGKTATLYVKAKDFKYFGELQKLDLIEVGTVKQNDRGYWNLLSYHKI